MKTLLLKLDANNHIREWSAWIEETDLIILTCQRGHAPIRHVISFNDSNHRQLIPKSNSPLEAAETELKRRIAKQKNRHGYSTTLKHRVVKPMLAHVFKCHAHKLPQRVFIQPKLNGLRCLASTSWLKSRQGTYFNLPHIKEALSNLPPDIILDGELYNHNFNLQTIMGIASRIDPGPEGKQLQLHVFDIIEESVPYDERLAALRELDLPPEIQRVDTLDIKLSDVQQHFEFYKKAGYEGAIVRHPKGLYQSGSRSSDLLKVKEVQLLVAKIIDILPQDKRPYLGKLHVQTASTKFFCSLKGSEEEKRRLMVHKSSYVGQLCQIEFEDYSEDNIPLKPICIKIG
jgi:ATP-dependent DNA ligase